MQTRLDDIGQRSETVRRANLGAIVRELHVRGPPSRSQLVARTGLTRSAIRSLIGELSAAGIVSEQQAVRSAPRPAFARGPPQPRSASRSPSRSRSTRWRRRWSASVARCSPSARRSPARPFHGGGHRRRPRAPRSHRAPGCRGGARDRHGRRHRRPRPTVATASCRWPRTSAGATSRSSNGSRAPWRVPARSPSPTMPTRRAGRASARRGAGRGQRAVRLRRGRRRRRLDRRRAAHGRGVAGYAGEVGHMPINPEGRTAAAVPGLLGDRDRRARAARRRRPRPRWRGVAREAVLEEAAAGQRSALDGDGPGRPLARHRARAARQRPQPAGSSSSAGSSAGSIRSCEWRVRAGDRAVRPARAPRAAADRARALGGSAPLVGAGELALEPLLIDPAAWLAPTPAAQSASA